MEFGNGSSANGSLVTVLALHRPSEASSAIGGGAPAMAVPRGAVLDLPRLSLSRRLVIQGRDHGSAVEVLGGTF